MATFSRTQRHGLFDESTGERTGFFRADGPSAVPALVQALITLDCRMRCPHCLAQRTGADELVMPPALFDALASQVSSLGVGELLVTGGEPLTHPDFTGIVESLRRRRINWTLNTAAMPGRTARKALGAWPPSFVAVSLDGPEDVHDLFRGAKGAHSAALESIRFFSGLAGNGVAAGTTVTTVNFPHLDQTFREVIASGATSWGIHLIVPEGRARTRPDLFLSRRQLKDLLRFVAARRNHFEVAFADEMGYCGAWEALVRPGPFRCGAGRTHCVVLPDGSVMPCSTCDADAAQGNLRETPLGEIWRRGFCEQREWIPKGACAGCGFARACGGGCWLQRRNGTHCFKDVWSDIPALSLAGQAAVVAVTLGISLAMPSDTTAGTNAAPAADTGQAKQSPGDDRLSAGEIDTLRLESGIILREAHQVRPGDRGPKWETERQRLKDTLGNDPAVGYFLSWDEGNGPKEPASWAKSAEKALQTNQRSLSLVCLLWRNAMDICLDGVGPAERTKVEREALRKGMALLRATGEAWHREIIARRLDPFLRLHSANGIYRSMICKGGPPRATYLAYDAALSRGFAATNRMHFRDRVSLTTVSDTLAGVMPFGKSMELVYGHDGTAGLKTVRAGVEQPADGRLEVFDILLVPPGGVTITLPFARGQTGAPGKTVIAALEPSTNIAAAVAASGFSVELPAGVELSYSDFLLLALEQNPQHASELLARPLRYSRPPEYLPGARRQFLKTRLAQLYLF